MSAASTPWSGSPKQTRKPFFLPSITEAAEAEGVMKNKLSSTAFAAKASQEPVVVEPIEICIPASINWSYAVAVSAAKALSSFIINSS